MKLIKFLCFTFLLVNIASLKSQTTYDELSFDSDSALLPYKAVSKNMVYIRSKRGSSGVNKTPQADAVLSMEISEIVLVFSELESAAILSREEANRERWENLKKLTLNYFNTLLLIKITVNAI